MTTNTSTTTSSNPDEIRREIEATRRELSGDVDALHDRVSPKRVVERRVDRTRGAMSRAKDSVMGSTDNGTSAVSSAASGVGDKVSGAPDQARARTQGNPMAAGLIAFGAGWLLSSLLPASEKEKQAATAVKETAQQHADAVKAPLAEAAQEVKENLKQPAMDAADSVRSTAQEGAEQVKGDARSAASDVQDQAKHGKEQMQSPGASSSGATDLRETPVGNHRQG